MSLLELRKAIRKADKDKVMRVKCEVCGYTDMDVYDIETARGNRLTEAECKNCKRTGTLDVTEVLS